jgi:myosin heavy subunit
MSNTIVGFTINIDGIQSINQLNAEIKQTQAAMNALDLSTEEGNKAFQELSQTLGKMTATQKALKKAQDDVNKSFLPEKAVGVYDQLSAKLNKLRKEFKNAALDGSKTTEELDAMQKEIQQLDKTLKNVDGQVGQFQRNVGNYPKTFAKVTRSLLQTIPGFEAFNSTLRNGEGQLTGFGKALIGGFVAFQAAKLIGQAMKRLDEFISKINETRETVAEFSGAYGTDLDKLTASTTALADTFDTDAKTISKAAESLSKQLGIGFEDALLRLEGALVEGQGNADDYLNNIAEFPAAFKAASGGVTEFSERNRSLLNTNKELAASQVEVAQKLQGVNDTFKTAGKAAETGLFLVLAKLIEIFRPVGDAFTRLGQAFAPLLKLFKLGGEETSTFTKIIEVFLFPIKVLADQLVLIAEGIAWMIRGFVDFINQSPFLQSIFEAIGNGIAQVYEGMTNLPAVFAGVIAALKQLGTNFVNFFQTLYLDAQIFAEQVKGVFGANVQSAIDDLRKRRAEANKDQGTLNDAFNKAYEESKKKSDAKREADAKAAAKKIVKVDRDANNAAVKTAQEAAKKLAEDRAKFQEDEIKQARQRAALLADLSAKAIEERIKNIQDGFEREVAEINNNFDKQKADLKKQYDDLVIAAQEREAELIKTFGKNAAEVLKVQKENAIQLQAVAQAQATILIQYEQQKTDALKKVNDEQRMSEVQKAQEQVEKLKELRDMALSSELDYIEQQGELRELKNQETLNKLLAQETDAKKKEQLIKLASEQETINKIANIRNQIQALNDAEAQLLDENKQLRVGISQEERDEIILQRQKLFTELSEIEKKQTEDVEKNAAEQTKIKQDQFNEIADYFKQGLDALSEVFNVVNERQQAAFDADIERSQLRQERLQEELDNSFGLRRRYYEQQLAAEVANQAAIEKAKEEARKRDAKRQKAIAIIQSIINTALAVTAALTAGGNPLKLATGAQIFEAAIIGALGAIQTGIIAAQPLAKGGVVGKGSEIVQFADGGRVTSRGNIKPLSNGDNVLATLKTGEVVLNQDQQRRIGYSTLKAARIPNFALGGVVGAPSGFLQDSLNKVSEEQNRFKVMQDLVLETQGRIDRLQVIYTASTDDDVEKGRSERKEIRATASF